ncbi:MAG: hypothetical protein FWE34_06345 [Defluviitaleaceae bacterium]|nr:hypothetical protein [Defluviitaleaceae bacterium]
MKRKIAICATFLSILFVPIAFGLIYFRPLPIIPSGSEAVIRTVWRDFEVINDQIDLERMVGILSSYYARRSFDNPFPNLIADVEWVISLTRGSSHANISLGLDSILYVSANDRIVYRIIDADLLMKELETLLPR